MKLMQYAAEAIDFQSPQFADDIVKLIEKIMKCKNGKEADASPEAAELRKTFEKQTNLKLNIKFNTEYPPCMMPIHINPNTILGDDIFKSYYTKDANKIMKELEEGTKSYIDLKNAKVGGIFSTIDTQIYMGFKNLKSYGINAREITAVLMHEVGHAFVAYELAFNTIQTNQILLSLHKSLLDNDQKLFEYTLKMTERKIGAESAVYTELKDVKDSKVVTTVVMAKMMERRKSELGTAAYDKSTYEALADNYATRMGLGRDLVTGLEKITKMYGGPEYSGSTRFLLNLSQLGAISYFMILGFVASPVLGLIFGGGLTLLISWLDSVGNEYTHVYDKLKVRFKRIREQIVGRLKNKQIPADVVKRALEDLAVIDKAINEAGDFTTLMGLLGNIIYPGNWFLGSRINAQRKIEELAANDLFVKAAQLRSI